MLNTRLSLCAQVIAMEGMYAGFAGAIIGHGRVTISRRFVLRLISRLKLVAFASLCGRYQRAMLAIGMVRHPDEYTVKSGEVDSWPGHQGRQPGNEIQRLEDYVSSAVPIRSF